MSHFFLGMLSKLRLDAFARQAGPCDRMRRITQHTDELGREYALQDIDSSSDIADIGATDSALLDVTTCLFSQGFDISQERLGYMFICVGTAIHDCLRYWFLA